MEGAFKEDRRREEEEEEEERGKGTEEGKGEGLLSNYSLYY